MKQTGMQVFGNDYLVRAGVAAAMRRVLALGIGLLFAADGLRAADDHGHGHGDDGHGHGEVRWIRTGHTGITVHYTAEQGLAVWVVGPEQEHHESGEGEEHPDDGHDHGEDWHAYGELLAPTEAIFVVGGAAYGVIEADARLGFLGEAGRGIYRISQQQRHGVPFFGFETEALEGADFAGDISIVLEHKEGPGAVTLYTVGGLGEVVVHWNTAVAGGQVYRLPPASHRHFNLSFSAAGEYHLHLQVSAQLAAGGQIEAEVALAFVVGGAEGFFSDVEERNGEWKRTSFPGWVYTAHWPWVYQPQMGWLYAWGWGGFSQLYYTEAFAEWIWMGEGWFPWIYRFGSDDWMLMPI